MRCLQCQFGNVDGAKFCNECGSKLEISCSKCGKRNAPGSKFCNECGNELKELQAVAPVDHTKPQSYTPKHLADKILTTRSSIEGERKLVTVFFADVAAYTAMSEKLDPEEVHQIMDGAFKILMDEIHKYEGTINQFTGDGVMALFGAPVSHEDHAQRACYAALAIQKTLGEYGEKIEKDTGVAFKMRVGLNSGSVIVGAIGDDLRMDYTAVGDTTNLGSRMESMARPGTILISGNTHRLVSDFFEFESLGKVKVKGKKEPQEAFELVKAGEVGTRIGASVAKGLTRFVGRKNSMAVLLDAFDKVKAGSGQVVGLLGEAGVGKSRLLLEMRNMLPQGEYHYLEGRCLQYGGSMAYLPMLDILRSYFDIKEGDREFLIKKKMTEKVLDFDEKLKGVIPPFQSLLSLKVDDEDFSKFEPKEKRERTFEALRDLMIRVSQEKPLVLTVEDLHWMDKTSEEFLDYLIGWLANTPILLLLLYRPEYTHPWGSKSYYTKVGLDQLGTNSSSELVKAILEEGEVAPELRQLILNRAAGNPLFMEEFTHTLLENGSIERKDEKYVLSGKASDIQVPDTIQGIIAARLDRLEDNLKRTMQVASVIGRDFAFRILQSITGMREELKAYLLNLQGLEFIYEKNLFPELEYIFKHALTQEVAYNSLLLKRRKEIHEKTGKAVEELYPERMEEFYEILAYHYARSDNHDKAYHYLKLSGNKATDKHSSWEAIRFYKEAIDILDRLPSTEAYKKEKLKIIQQTTFPMLHLGYPEDFFPLLEEGERLSNKLEDKRSLAMVYGRMGSYYAYIGKPMIGIEYSEKAFDEAQEIQDIELMAPLAFELVTPYFGAGEFIKIVDIASKVLRLIEKTRRESDYFGKDMNVYSALCGRCGGSLGWLGNFEEGKIFLEKGALNALKLGDLRALALIELYYGHLFLYKGDWTHAKAHYQKCIKHSEELNWTMLLGLAWSALGYARTFLKDSYTGLKCIEKGLKIQNDAGIEWWLPIHYWMLSVTHFDMGNIVDARRTIEKALILSEKNNEKSSEGISLVWFGRVLAKADSSGRDKAKANIRKGVKILSDLNLKPFYSLGYLFIGEICNDAGEKKEAMENLKKAEEMFVDMGMDYWLARTKVVMERL